MQPARWLLLAAWQQVAQFAAAAWQQGTHSLRPACSM
jgi:hypothetical protein